MPFSEFYAKFYPVSTEARKDRQYESPMKISLTFPESVQTDIDSFWPSPQNFFKKKADSGFDTLIDVNRVMS